MDKKYEEALLTKDEIDNSIQKFPYFPNFFREVAQAQLSKAIPLIRAEAFKEVGEFIEKDYEKNWVSIGGEHNYLGFQVKKLIQALKSGNPPQEATDG